VKTTPAADLPLAALTTLGLGGPARWVFTAEDETEVREIRAWARARGLPIFVLGGGSNVVAADAGFAGVVLQAHRLTGVRFDDRGGGDEVWVTAAAGEPWDALVTLCVSKGLAGIECLAGIPGLVGATPIQNVGAYGQEVGETIREVRALDLAAPDDDAGVVTFDNAGCRFEYRDSLFRHQPGRYMLLSVTFALRPSGAPTVRYAELASALVVAGSGASPAPSLDRVSETVRALRRAKSMLIEAGDANRRSVGSFFTNPVLTAAQATEVTARAARAGTLADGVGVPQFPLPDGRVKLSAAWLIERAGFPRGTRRGAVGISTRHALALVHHGGGTTAALLALAYEIRDAVRATFGVILQPEPVMLGLDWQPAALP
jgi:UDP-N-acetylmuramate dehydrogenase